MRRIIGIGSPFGADRLGWQAIDLLAGETLPATELLKLDRPGSELIRYLGDVDEVVIIDAVQAGRRPGSVLPLKRADLATLPSLDSAHGFGVAEALALAERLDALPARIRLLGIEAGMDPALPVQPDLRGLIGGLSGAVG